jgi:hypothetical protein
MTSQTRLRPWQRTPVENERHQDTAEKERYTMPTFVRSATRWVSRHAFPAAAAAVIAVGAAGAGIGYAVAAQHNSPASSTPTPSATLSPGTAGRSGAVSRAEKLLQSALGLLASQTGQSVAAVRSQLEAGKSIDDIAGARAPAIESSILAQVTKIAGRAVSAGRITAAQETAGLAIAKTKIEALMAEPGTQLLINAKQAFQFLQQLVPRGAARPTAPSPSPSP